MKRPSEKWELYHENAPSNKLCGIAVTLITLIYILIGVIVNDICLFQLIWAQVQTYLTRSYQCQKKSASWEVNSCDQLCLELLTWISHF